MTTKAATEEVLGELHGKVATVMTGALATIEKAQDAYLKAESPTGAAPEVSAPLLGVITKFLNDNKITCVPAESTDMSDLAKRLANKRKSVGNVVHAFKADE